MWKQILRNFLLYGFATYGGIWTVVESSSAYFPTIKPEGLKHYLILVVLSVTVGIWRAFPKKTIELVVPNSDSSFVIEFGDIFQKNGCIAIPVNEYFDSQLGDHVSPNSLHGQFINSVLGGQSSAFDSLVSQALSKVTPIQTVSRCSGKQLRFTIGTTACLKINNKNYLLFALSKTDLHTLKASASIHELWDALAGLWESIRNNSNGDKTYIPLIGSGLSGVGLPPENLAEIIIISYFYYTKKHKITDRVTLVLPRYMRYKIDLSKILNNWS